MLFRSLAEIQANPTPRPRPLISKLVNEGELIIVTGQYDSYKSTFCLEMARSVVAGDKFLDNFPVHTAGPALIVQKEIHPGFYDNDRVVPLDIPEHLKGSLLVSYDDFRFSRGYGTILADIIRDKGLKLVVFDPLTNFWPLESNFDENNNSMVSSALAPLYRMRSMGVSFVLVHHDPKPSKDYQGRARGASTLLNAPDVRILIDREEDSNEITVHARTRNIVPVRAFHAYVDELRKMRYKRDPTGNIR